MDIKTIATAVGLFLTISGLLIFQGQLIQRIDVIESQTAPNIKPLEQDIAILKAELRVLETKVEQLKAQSDNPLSQ